MKTIYLAGHGRVYYQKTHKVPDGVTLKFVVPDKCTNSGGVSKAVISGASNFTSLTLSAGEEYNEHYLCADIAMIKASKGEAAKKASREALIKFKFFHSYFLNNSQFHSWRKRHDFSRFSYLFCLKSGQLPDLRRTDPRSARISCR